MYTWVSGTQRLLLFISLAAMHRFKCFFLIDSLEFEEKNIYVRKSEILLHKRYYKISKKKYFTIVEKNRLFKKSCTFFQIKRYEDFICDKCTTKELNFKKKANITTPCKKYIFLTK